MISLSKHTAQILDESGQPLPVDPVQVSIGMDDEWSPYIQGRIIVHASDADVLDRDRVTIRLRQQFGAGISIAAITDWAGGSVRAITRKAGGSVRAITRAHTTAWNLHERIRSLAAHTARWHGRIADVTAETGGSMAAITRAMRQTGGAFDPPPAEMIETLVRVRPAETDHGSMLIEYAVDGEDIALHDYRRTETTTWTSGHTKLRALVAYLLTFVGGTLLPSPDPTIIAGTTWMPGQTIWDALHPVLEATGYRLTADEAGRYRLDPDGQTPTSYALDADTNLISYRSERAPEYDGTVVEYTAVTPSRYDVHAPLGAQRIMHETRYTTYPGPGAAEQLTARALARGRSARAEATSNYNLRPRDRISIKPDADTVQATVSAVTWTYPDSRMSVTARDITT